MPNWTFIAVSFLYHLGLSIWIGGIVVLGGLIAPRLFRTLDRETAGATFGAILKAFLRLRTAALAFVIGAALARHLMWETSMFASTLSIWIMIRWMCLTFLASEVCYELLFLEGAVETAYENRRVDGAESVSGRRFEKLHRRSELLMKVSFVAALGALLLS